jgi:hypothetical protein
MRMAQPIYPHLLSLRAGTDTPFWRLSESINGGPMNFQLQEKIREFRDRAQQNKLKATFSDERVVKKIYEDAARQWEDLADNLERTGRPY